jgi:hypothetical protein
MLMAHVLQHFYVLAAASLVLFNPTKLEFQYLVDVLPNEAELAHSAA